MSWGDGPAEAMAAAAGHHRRGHLPPLPRAEAQRTASRDMRGERNVTRYMIPRTAHCEGGALAMTREELREARAQAVQRHSVALQDDWRKALPRLLDELDALDEQYADGILGEKPEMIKAVDDEQMATWIRDHPREFEAWVRKWERINGTSVAHAPRRARK